MLTAPGAITLHSLLESLLVPAVHAPDRLTWLQDGGGVGAEMKRGFSGILGRFFARWYLETHHGLTDMVPISGEGPVYSHNVVVLRKGRINLPDWVCLGPTGQPVLAESKGSHNRSRWAGPLTASPLEKAKEQLQSAVVQMRSPATGRLRRVKVKGWAVMSRWSTVQNMRPPLLYVLDPETQGHEMTVDEGKRAAQDIRRAVLAGFMRVLGHPNLAARFTVLAKAETDVSTVQREISAAEMEWTSESVGPPPIAGAIEPVLLSEASRLLGQPPSIELEVVSIADDHFAGRRFIGGIVDLTGRLVPNNVSEVLQGRTIGPTGVYRNLYFAGFDVSALIAALGEEPPTKIQPLRVDRRQSESLLSAILALGDGFILAPIEAISQNVEAVPAELT
jgi:hypothetical protein